MPTPIESMRLVAQELESVGLSFALVGGCAVWLLVDRPDLTDFRPTEGVDVIIGVVTLQAKVITPPLFLATKLAAFHDRAHPDLLGSHDVKDTATTTDGCNNIEQ